MSVLSRRDFLSTAGSFALRRGRRRPQFAAMGPNDKFDLVIKGGDVLDPSQNAARQARHRHPLRPDRGARGRHPGRARRCACSTPRGKLVTPGLIDLHCARLSRTARRSAFRPTSWCRYQCTTTCVSAGDAGANNFAAFRRYIVAQTRTRLYAFVHIANIGLTAFPVAELYNIDFAQVDACGQARSPRTPTWCSASRCACRENVIAKHGIEPLKRAITACEMAGTGAQGHVPHRRRRDARADVADPRPAARRATS